MAATNNPHRPANRAGRSLRRRPRTPGSRRTLSSVRRLIGGGQKIAVAAGMTSPIWPTPKGTGKVVVLGL